MYYVHDKVFNTVMASFSDLQEAKEYAKSKGTDKIFETRSERDQDTGRIIDYYEEVGP